MRVATFIMAFALPFTSIHAQNQEVIRPGDILSVKVLWPPKMFWPPREAILPIKPATVYVKSDGKMAAPIFPGLTPTEAVSVEGLGLDAAAQRLLDSYKLTWGQKPKVVIERGTLTQLR
jgi:hypothetical protein